MKHPFQIDSPISQKIQLELVICVHNVSRDTACGVSKSICTLKLTFYVMPVYRSATSVSIISFSWLFAEWHLELQVLPISRFARTIQTVGLLFMLSKRVTGGGVGGGGCELMEMRSMIL